MPGSAARFGESAAILLGDMCLVWAEQMLRSSGVRAAALERVWPRYDQMRTELAVGQLSDLVNVTSQLPTLDQALDIAARKSGNYTVRRPLEIGAAMAGCDERSLWLLGRYGTAGQDEPLLVKLHAAGQPLGVRVGPDEEEQRPCVDSRLDARIVPDANGLEMTVSFQCGHHGPAVNLDVVDLLDAIDEVP